MKLYPGRAPNYRLKQDYGELTQGTFVRPVRVYHLPKHIRDQVSQFFDEEKDVHCYTSKGFVVIPWALLEVC